MQKPIPSLGSCLILVCVLALSVAGQDAPPPPVPAPVAKAQPEDQNSADPCPKITLKTPNQPVRDGVPVRIAAALAGGDKKVVPMFDWSISAGAVRSGHGTANIEVDTTGAGAERAIRATVLIGGFSPECTSSETAVVQVAGPAQKAEEFGAIPADEMASRIDGLISSVSPMDQIHIFAYAGRTNIRGFASSTLKQIRAHALKSGITSDRLVTVDGGYRDEPAFELWVVPIGSEPPRPSPTVSARDIVFPKSMPPAKRP